MSVTCRNVQFDWQVFIVSLTCTSADNEREQENIWWINWRGTKGQDAWNNFVQWSDWLQKSTQATISWLSFVCEEYFNDTQCSEIFKESDKHKVCSKSNSNLLVFLNPISFFNANIIIRNKSEKETWTVWRLGQKLMRRGAFRHIIITICTIKYKSTSCC